MRHGRWEVRAVTGYVSFDSHCQCYICIAIFLCHVYTQAGNRDETAGCGHEYLECPELSAHTQKSPASQLG